MKYTPKDKQKVLLRSLVEEWIHEFEQKYPTKTINNHHYIRRRHLEQFMYDFADAIMHPNTTVDL